MISVIVPVYNAERYIAKCALSLLCQTHLDYEVIFVDDCSTDNSLVALKRALKDQNSRNVSVKILEHDRNRGVGAARNTGLQAAQGEWCVFVDSDDWVGEGYLADLFADAKEGDLVYAGVSYEKAGGESYVRRFVERAFCLDEMPAEDWGNLFRYSFACAKLFDLTIIRRFGIQFSRLPLHEDTAFVFDYLVHAQRVRFTSRAEYHYWQENAASATQKRYSSEVYLMISQELLMRWEWVFAYMRKDIQRDVRQYIQRFGVSQLLLAVDVLYDHPVREKTVRRRVLNALRARRKLFADYYRPSSFLKRVFVFIVLWCPLWIVDITVVVRKLILVR